MDSNYAVLSNTTAACTRYIYSDCQYIEFILITTKKKKQEIYRSYIYLGIHMNLRD